MIRTLRSSLPTLAVAALLPLAACVTDDVAGPNDAATAGTFTVDATSQWRYVSFDDSALVSPAPSALESTAWDIAFNATNITLNGGAAGPGGIEAACVCQNAAATGDEVLAMTPESELADFTAVTTVPAGLTFVSDALTPAINGWFAGTGAAVTPELDKAWLVRTSDSLAYAVVRIAAITNATATSAGRVTLEFKRQAANEATAGAVQSLEVDLATGPKSVDLNSGAVTTSATDWDLRLDGFTIRVNGGISGAGKGGAAASAASLAATATAITQANAYRADVYAGIFGTARYYRYNIAGDNRISPSFDVYLVRRGAVTYKLQVTGYYSATGAPRHVSFRWQRLDD